MDVDDYSVPVEELVSAVRYAVEQAGISTTDEGRDLRVASVQLILSAVVTTKAGGGVDFRVPVIGWKVKVGGSRSHQKTHTIDITLVAEDLQDRHELRHSAVAATLVDAITTIRAVVAAGSGGDDPLVLKAGTVELVFGVTEQGTISVGAEGELTDEVTNTLRIELVAATAE
ncbi:trypco2 family protein [Micromonospora sp. NPDC005215]|uniref:trypco2 family protein n=1 Tax=Micromonospora sp. NPDC005215 TaxID=3157024 RepID=UPI0033A65EAB